MATQTMSPEELAEALARATPDWGPERVRLAVALLRLLARGEPVGADALAKATGEDPAAVAAELDDMAGVFRDEEGAIVGFFGLAIPEMAHRLEVDGRRLHGWCAWDTLFLPELLGRTARVSSECAATGEPVELTVDPAGGVTARSHRDMTVSFLMPSGAFDENVMQTFCHHVHFFVSREAGEGWAKGRENVVLLGLDEAHEVGRLVNRATFGAALPVSAG